MKPRHEHFCDKCTFLGYLANGDAYYCKGTGGTSYLIRNSGMDSDYASQEDFSDELYHTTLKRYDFSFAGMSSQEVEIFIRRVVLITLLASEIATMMSRTDV